MLYLDFPGGSVSKGSSFNAEDMGDTGLIPGSGRFPGGGHNNPLQYSCLENPMDRGAWGSYSPWGCKESDMTEVTKQACMHVMSGSLQGHSNRHHKHVYLCTCIDKYL